MKPPFANTLAARRHVRAARLYDAKAETYGRLAMRSDRLRCLRLAADEYAAASRAHAASAQRWLTVAIFFLVVALAAQIVDVIA